ncbi:MAG TPA: YidC/Oxa1 family membrane protein insertase [Candidatus Paceibacterota bacterium]
MAIYQELFYRPLFNIVVAIYNFIPGHDFGMAIIILTVLIRVIFLPLSIKTQRSQKALQELNPKIKEIREKYKSDKVAQNKAIMELYKESKVNPLGGCLPLIIQLPILIALYQAFIAGLNPESLSLLYSFIKNPEVINKMFLGLIDITKSNISLVLAAGVLQFLQAKQSAANTSLAAGNEMAALNKQMLYFFPLFIIIIGWKLPAGLILYWIATTLFSIGEQTYIQKKK